jgi:phenylpyruvate tautomerase PptA (4-oxalocrotonate tautomerase family)
MPVVRIEYVRDDDGTAPRGALAQELADAVGRVLGAADGTVWVRLRALDRSGYAENGGGGAAFSPVFVEILLRDFKRGPEIDARAAELANAIGRVLGRPAENVHILFEPSARGRIAFGGEFPD